MQILKKRVTNVVIGYDDDIIEIHTTGAYKCHGIIFDDLTPFTAIVETVDHLPTKYVSGAYTYENGEYICIDQNLVNDHYMLPQVSASQFRRALIAKSRFNEIDEFIKQSNNQDLLTMWEYELFFRRDSQLVRYLENIMPISESEIEDILLTAGMM